MSESATDQFERKLRAIAPLRVERPTAAKYRPIAERLERVASEFPPNTRLPSIRTLAGLFGVTTVPIHRAVTELVQRGVLYAQTGRGIYVNDRKPAVDDAPPAASPPISEPFVPVATRCTLGVSLKLEHHRSFWQQAVERFEQQYPLTRIELRPYSASSVSAPAGDVTGELDVRELPGTSVSREGEASRLLNLADFRGEGDDGNLVLLGATLAPVHLSVPCLYYNKTLLERHGIAPPRFASFAEQVRYFEQLPANTETPMAESVVQPLAWLGREVQTLLDWLKRESPLSPAERARLIGAMESIARIRQTMHSLSGRYAFNADRFAEGTLPLFHGWSYNYGYLKSRNLPFEFGVAPWLGSDDQLFALPLCVAVSDEAPHCAECVRLVRHLQSPETQQLLAATGNLPFDARQSESTFLARDNDPAFVRSLFERAYLHPAFTSDDVYLSRHVINDELWRYLHGRVSASEALDEMLWLGRGASRQFARRRQQHERGDDVLLAGAASA